MGEWEGVFNITDTVNCSSGMYSGEGARLCQKQSVAGLSEQTSIRVFAAASHISQ